MLEQVRRWRLREDEIGDKEIKLPILFTKKSRKPKGTLKVKFIMKTNSEDLMVTVINDSQTNKQISDLTTEENPSNKEDRNTVKRTTVKPAIKPKSLILAKLNLAQSVTSNRTSFHSTSEDQNTQPEKLLPNISADQNEDQKKIETSWKEQEEIIKEHDQKRKLLLKKVREVGRSESVASLHEVSTADSIANLSISNSNKEYCPPLSAPVSSNSYPNMSQNSSVKPTGRSSIIKWFKEVEEPRGAGRIPSSGQIAEWFHGIISREESESLLSDRPIGSFLIRVSDKIWGYTVSYKSNEKCKHFLVDASPAPIPTSPGKETKGAYRFFGAQARIHESLYDFVQHHRKIPISLSGCELLIHACGQKDPDRPDHQELFNN